MATPTFRGLAGLVLAGVFVALAAGLGLRSLVAPTAVAPRRADDRAAPAAAIPAAGAALPADYAGLATEARRLGSLVRVRYPDSPQATALEAAVLTEAGDHGEAAAAWRSHLARHPQSGEGWYRLGLHAAREGRDEEAADMLERARRLDPSLPDIQGHLGRTLLKLDRVDDAAAVLEAVVGEDRGAAVRLFHLGHARLRQGRDEEALAAFRSAVEKAPGYTGAWYGLATAAARLGREREAEEARETFRRAKLRDAEAAAANVSRDETDRIRLQLARWYASAGRIAAGAGDAAGAERAWTRGLAVAPEFPDNRRWLAELHRRQGRAIDAVGIAGDEPRAGE